jgi:signal transduction histidine kinase
VSEVLQAHPEVVRVLHSVFDVHLLPNRAELRLRPTGKVIGYTLALVRDDGGYVIGASMFFKDLTRVEQLEERERLRDRLAAVGEMAAAIAHEVKNPLAGIEVMAGLLRRKISDAPDAQAVLTDIINEAKMANAIVQEVLEFVRPIRLQVEHTAVADAVQAAVQLADTKARRGGIQVEVNVPQGLPLIHGDQHQLTQLFTNLLMNAYEAMNGAGRVTFAARPIHVDDGLDGREAVIVELADEGPGMPQDVADRVFNPFFTTKPQGSGLGLAIVRKIVDAHDGSIDLETAPGRGTVIRVTLPVSGSEEGV